MEIRREKILAKLVEIQYARNDMDFHRGTFRARGDVIEIFPASNDAVSVRIELFGDVVDAIHEIDPLTGKSLRKLPRLPRIFSGPNSWQNSRCLSPSAL